MGRPGAFFAVPRQLGALAQLGERRLCKPEVTGSIPVRSIEEPAGNGGFLFAADRTNRPVSRRLQLLRQLWVGETATVLPFDLSSGCYLRLFEESDAEELERVVAANRAHLAEWLDWAGATEGWEAWLAFIRSTREKVGANDGFVAAIIDGEAIVGQVGFDRIDWDSRSTSIGYWLARDRQGRGIMTEAVAALTSYAFDAWKLNRVEIRVAAGNQRSAAIAQRLGFREEGVRQQERHWDSLRDIVIYSMHASEWDGSAGLRR